MVLVAMQYIQQQTNDILTTSLKKVDHNVDQNVYKFM